MKYTKLHVLICVLFVSVWGIAQTVAYDPSVFINININSGNPAYPFPQFLEYKGGGKSLAKYNAEGVTHADMEKTLREAYEIMMHRCRYEGKYCGVDYISFNRDDVAGNYGTFVSEGDGYALLAAAIFADQKTFNGLYMWIHDIRFSGVKRFRDGGTRGLNANDYAGPYLAAWKDKTFNAAYGSDSHSATDGDVDIAMAMLIAYKQWGEWMMQDGAVVKDNAGNPISLKYETQRVVGALVDTLGQWDKGSGALTGELSGVVGIDGYEKRGNSWGELTRWRFTDAANAQYPGVNGPYNVGPNLLSIYGGNYIDYDAPSYFEEFWRWLKNGDGVDSNNENLAPWEIHQFKRAAASGNWLNQQAYNQGYYASIGNVSMNTDGSPTFGVYVDGEDFRYCWRHVLDYLWHGDADYDWNPTTHQVIEGQTNNSERLMGIRHAALLKNPSNSGTQLCSKMGASPDPGQPLWFGVSQIPQQWRLDGGITSAYHTNYSVGAGATAAVASEDLELLADIYRQCEIMWDGNNTAAKLDPEERYIGSTPKYFHGWFRTLGMLVCSGNLQAPEDMKPAANMKVYMSVDKTYAYEGDKVAYTVQYRNYGSLDAQNVKIQTPLDEDYTFVSATKGGVYDPATHTITWNIGTVKGFKSGGLAATQDSVAFTVKITSLANSRVCETSTISGSNFDEWISNEYPNHATYTMERNCVDVLANRSLILEKTANRTEMNPGDKVTFTVDFENVSSEDSWMNGGRDNVRISYGNYYMKGNAYQFYHLYRFWNDSYEAYINMNNYRVSYFMYDAAAQGLYDAATNPTGWTFVVDNQNDLDKYGYNPATGPITFTYQKIPQGEDEYGKWNQRLMIRFADVLMAPSTHVYDKLDSQYLLHKGVWGPGFIRARLASNPNSDLTTRVQDDWSFSTDITAGTIDGQGETFTLITPCWANYENLGYEIDNYSRHTCSSPISKLKNFDRVLVEEFDGYTWRRIQGRGPLPGKEAYHVTIVDTIPKELTFDAFVTKKALGIDATYTAAPTGASYSGIVKWTIPEMLVGESGKLVYTCVAKDLGCPNVEDTYYINAAWIYSDTDSPDSSFVELMTTCSDLPPYIEPQDALFKTASVTTASVGDEISYELKYVNTKGTIVDDDCSSTTNWMTLGNGSMSTVSNGALKLSGSYFFGPKYSYGKDGAVYLSFTGKPYATQNLYFVMRYESGTPGNSNFKGVCMKLLINIDGNHNFGYELYNNGTLLKKEGSGWADAIQYSGDAENPVFKFVLNGDHLYMYINDAENDWTSVVKDWSGLTTSPGYFGMYVNSNGNNQTALNNFRSELDYGFDIQLSDELPSELTNITNISGSGTYSAGTNKITWPMVSGPIAPNDEVSYTFDATVHACNSYINNYGVAKVYGQDEIRVVNSVKCGASVCPDAPETEDVSVCVGEVKNLSATGETNAKYTWYSSATGTETVSPKFTATEVGTFDFYVSQTVGGCESARTKLTVTVTQPEKPVVSNVSLCKNQTSVDELTATGSSLKWYNGSDVELSAAPVPDVSIEGDVSYFVTQTVDGCESEKAEITVSVGALPKPTTENVTYCLGEEVSALTATATESLRWYETETGGTASTQIIPLTSSVGTTTYYVSQTTGECESERASLVVTVKPNPVATISATAEGYCGEASDVKLSLESDVALTTATFKWLNGTAVAGTSSTIVNAEAGTYTCTLELDGCEYTTESKTIVKSENPTYTITGAGSYCPESTSKDPVVITFTSGTAPFTYTESVTGEGVCDKSVLTIDNPVGGLYKLTSLKDAGGCEMTAIAPSVEVFDLETPDLSIGTIKSVCAGSETIDVSSYVTTDVTAITYSSDKGSISTAGVLSGLTDAGDYTVSVQIAGNVAPYCTNTKTATVTVYANPSVSFADDYDVCSGKDVDIKPIVEGTTSYTSLWTGEGLNGTGLNEPTFNAVVSDEIQYDLSVVITDKTNGCTGNGSVKVSVHPNPLVSLAASETKFCKSVTTPQEIMVSVMPTSVTTGDFVWTNVASSATIFSGTFVPSEHDADTYEITYQITSETGCASNTASLTMDVFDLPEISIEASSADVCINGNNSDDIVITPSRTSGSFDYSVNNGGSISTAGVFATTNPVGEYVITLNYTDENNCKNEAQTTVNIHDLPTVKFADTNPNQICYNTSAISLAVEPDMSTAKSYSFVGTSALTSADFNPATSSIGNNTITYTYTDEYNCQNSASFDIEVVKVLPPTVEAPNPKTVTVDDGGNLLDVTTMTAVPNVSTDVVVWQTVAGTELIENTSYTSPETVEGEYTYFVKEYRTINGKSCYSDSTMATLVLSNCTAKSPIVENQKLCMNDDGAIMLTAEYAASSTNKKLSWFEDKTLTSLLQDDSNTYSTTVSTDAVGEFTYYVAEYDANKDCWSVPTPITVTVNALPTVEIAPIDYICYAGGDYAAQGKINGTLSNLGSWSSKGGDFTVDTYGVINSISAGKKDGIYTVVYTYTDDHGCTNSAEEEFSIEYPEIPTSAGYLGIVSKPLEVEISVNATSLETGYSSVNWYNSLSSSTTSYVGDSWKPGDSPTNEHISKYYVSQTVHGCESEKAEVLVQIVSCPFAQPVATPVVACKNGTLSDLQASLPSTTTVAADKWIWYNSNKQELSGNTNTLASGISTSEASVTKFYVGYLATEPTTMEQCPSPLTEVTVTVNDLPNITFGTSNKSLVCYDEGNVIMTALPKGGTWKLNDAENNGLTTAGVFSPDFFGQKTDTYELSYTYTDETTGCVNTERQNITVQYAPAPVATGFSSLVSESAVVSVSAEPDVLAEKVSWYTVTNEPLANGAVFKTGDDASLPLNKSYYVSQTINGCESEKSEAKVLVINCPIPKPNVIQPSPICNYDDAPELTASLGDWAERPTGSGSIVFNFYDDENATTPISSDLEGTFTPNIDKTKAATYTFWVAEYNENVVPAACEGKRAKVTLNVVKTSEPKISLSLDAICQYEDNPTLRGIGENIQWYENEPTYPAENPDGDGTSYIPSFDQVGNHTVWMTQTVDGCLSEAVSASYEIKPIPNKPQTQDASVCETNNNAAVRATADNGGFITWYMNIDATGLLVKSSDYSPSVANPGTYTYYATQTVDGCESQTEIAIYTIKPLPKVPVIETNSVSCDYDTEHILSVASKENVEVVWYSSMDTTSFLATGNVYTHTVTSSGMQRYFARQRENGCLGNYAMAAFNIVESPAKPMVKNDVVCYASTANLSSDGLKDSWYSDEELTSLESIGNSLQIDNVTDDIVYYVVRERNGCMSPIAEAAVHVIAAPKVSILVDEEELPVFKRCEYDEEKTLETLLSPEMGEDDYVEWHIFPGNKTIQTTGSLRMSDYVTLSSPNTESTNYTVRAQYMVKNASADEYCKSDADTIKIITNAKARTPIVLSKVICQGEEIEPLFAFGSPNITWMSIDGILPLISQGTRYTFATKQGDIPVGSYHFIVFDENTETGCHSDSTTVEMILAPAAQTKIYGADSVCIGATEEYFTTFDSRSTYMWSVTGGNSNYSKDATATSVRYVDWMNQGIDTLVVFEQTWAGCQGSDTMIVKIANTPKAMFTWSLPGESNVIELVDSTVQDSICDITPSGERIAEEVPYTLYWNYGHQGELEDVVDLEVPYEKRRFPIREDSYVYGYNCPILTVENSYGCKDVYNECIFINITSGLFVPTAFAPTNPAHDVRYFQPKGYNLKTCEVSVYDKWGNLLWFSNEVEDGMFVGRWDGTYDGKKLASDTYIWKIEATFMDGQIWEGYSLKNGKKTKYGNVVLIR